MEIIPLKEITKNLKPGTVIWRSGTFLRAAANMPFVATPVPFAPARGDKGGFTCRVVLGAREECIFEPVAYNVPEDNTETKPRGIITFLRNPPMPNWTYLVVSGVSKSGTALFAEYGGSHSMPEYIQFRDRYARNIRRCNRDTSMEEKLEIAQQQDFRVPNSQHHRLFTGWTKDGWVLEPLS